MTMADPVELIAVERGFLNNELVEPGTRFTFTPKLGKDGKPRLPKWAAKPGDPRLTRKADLPVDTRPIAAQQAVRKKVGAITG